jgi:hypothetical protein
VALLGYRSCCRSNGLFRSFLYQSRISRYADAACTSAFVERAAELAAKLANEECERLYSKRPFKATQHKAVLEGDSYRWGRLDPGGLAGCPQWLLSEQTEVNQM